MSESRLFPRAFPEIPGGVESGWRGEGQVAAPVLMLEEVCKSYAAGVPGCSAVARVLDGVSLRVGAGEIVGIAGEEGAGKSTLLLCAAGVVRPERGRVLWAAMEQGRAARNGSLPSYLDLRGGRARREIESVIVRGAPIILLDHASPAILAELRAMVAPSGRRCREASAMVITSRSSAELARVASRVLVLREGRLLAEAPRGGGRPAPGVAPPRQRKRSAAWASSEFPAAFALARMRST